MTEWRTLKDFPLYEISCDGTIRRRRDGRVRKSQIAQGYRMIRLYTDGATRTARTVGVHHLLAQAFIPKPEGTYLVRHLNDEKLDNRLENLAWGTDLDNARDQLRNGHHWLASKTHCKRGHEFTPENTLLKSGRGHRACRKCRADQQRERYAAGRIYVRKDGKPNARRAA